MIRGKALRKNPQLHLAMMVSLCAILAGCETTGETAKTNRQMSGQAQLAAPGAAVAKIELPNTPAETLYPVTVAYEPAVDPVLAAEAVDPSLIPGAVPVPRPSPLILAVASSTQVAALQSVADNANAQGQPVSGTPATEMQMLAAGSVAASPLATKGARPGTPVTVASATGIPASIMLSEQIAPQVAVPATRPLGYASPANANAALAAISGNTSPVASTATSRMGDTSASRNEIDALISRYSAEYGVPEKLIHRVVHRESRYNSSAYNKRGYFGLMQIAYPTAKSMGYQGPASGLLDAETNLKYAIKYLRGAYMVADTDHDNAVRFYARGYYYDAKRKGMLHVLK